MCKVCWSVVVVLLITTIGLSYKFIIHGEVAETDDNRIAIVLQGNERDFVLSEMRIFLQSVQQIISGISKDDMSLVVSSARKSGKSAQAAVPGALMGKLPLGFKKLGSDTHVRFDQLALDAEQLGDPDHSLTQLNTLMENCVSCHAAYRFELSATASN